ncbi:Nn.00g059650.m01.CDS01 [Neocucurbitaria sp. VM-36]
MDDLEICTSSSTIAQSRRRPHTPMMWAKIQASVKLYYIDLDMTLEDTMQKISEKHNFHATGQMYKKRLKAWGFSKQVKSNEKEKALATILHNEPAASDHYPIRHDKLVRYAKSRVKSGALDNHHLSRIVRRHTTVVAFHHAANEVRSVPRSLALPDQFAGFDEFLRAMRAVIERERGEWLTGRQMSPDAIYGALTRGMSLWRNNAFAAARVSFGQAASKTIEDLKGTEASVSRITYCISSILWGSEREPVFRKFTEFMVKAAMESWDRGAQ